MQKDDMDQSEKGLRSQGSIAQPVSMPELNSHGRIIAVAEAGQHLNPIELDQLERSFRAWAQKAIRPDLQFSRQRILLIFLLIRYTGAKLSEILALNPFHDIDHDRQSIFFGNTSTGTNRVPREVQISEALSAEIRAVLGAPSFKASLKNIFGVDPGFVRRKFYERAEACGFPKRLGAPEMIRKSRAVELMQGNMPLPAVQMLLGHSTPNLTTAYVSFSGDDIQQVTKFFIEKESARKTSARNSFIGKIRSIRQGDIQSQVDLITISGQQVTTVITNDSLERLCLREGRMITAEVKAPWVLLHKGEKEPGTTAENRFHGTIRRISHGQVTTEYVVRLADGTEVCSVVTTESSQRLDLQENDPAWISFNCFSVVLHAD